MDFWGEIKREDGKKKTFVGKLGWTKGKRTGEWVEEET